MNIIEYSKNNNVEIKELKDLLDGLHHMKVLTDEQIKILDDKYNQDSCIQVISLSGLDDVVDVSTITITDDYNIEEYDMSVKPEWATDVQWLLLAEACYTKASILKQRRI